jgi:hypothetical protein
MGATIGILAVLFPVYEYWQGLLIFIGIIIFPFIITRNVALSMGTGLVALPFIIWLGTHSNIGIIMSIILGIIIAIKFMPTARDSWAKVGNAKEFIFDRWRREKKSQS